MADKHDKQELASSYTERKQTFKYLLKIQPKSCLRNSARIFSTEQTIIHTIKKIMAIFNSYQCANVF